MLYDSMKRRLRVMARYKGRQNAKAVERDFPHFVDIIVPLGGLGASLDAMCEFHALHGIKPQRGQWTKVNAF
jgi:hypothetical protein